MARQKKQSSAQPLLLTVAEVAIMLGVCRDTVYTLIYEEGLPSIMLKGNRRVHPDSLHAWIKKREKGA
jgi:excisionase family DNA binding protein